MGAGLGFCRGGRSVARFVAGDVVVVPFPSNDLASSKVRPPVVLATSTPLDQFIASAAGEKLSAFMTPEHLLEAQAALRLNGFRRCDEDPRYSEMFARPEPPFHRVNHPNGPIYSSAQF
jgi:hypothetical protein